MRPTVVAILGLAVALFAPGSTAAQGESPEARELASLIFSPAAYDLIFTNAAQLGALTAKAGLEERLGRSLTDDELRRLGELCLRLFNRLGPSRAQIEAIYVDFFARYYSVQERKDLIAFYRTPLGVKVLRFPVAITDELRPAIERLMASSQPEFVRRFGPEFARKFPDLHRELEQKQRP